jgi:hypothetical protein
MHPNGTPKTKSTAADMTLSFRNAATSFQIPNIQVVEITIVLYQLNTGRCLVHLYVVGEGSREPWEPVDVDSAVSW